MMPTLFHVPILGWPIRGYGFMMMVGFLSAIWMAARRAQRVKQDPDLILNVGFIALIGGVVGARLFYVIHYWESSFARHPNPILAAFDITSGGLEFYGGFLFVLVLIIGYIKLKGVSLRLYTDIMAPALMWGLAFGRMGCFLNGCCWGAVCADAQGHKALPWALTFPYGSPAYANQWSKRQLTTPAELLYVSSLGDASPISRENINASVEKIMGPKLALQEAQEALAAAANQKKPQAEIDKLTKERDRARQAYRQHVLRFRDVDQATGVFSAGHGAGGKPTLSELRDRANKRRSLPVHPTQLYSAINALLISLVLSALFARRRRHGILPPVLFILYSVSRVVLERVRVDNPIDTGGMTISQAISVAAVIVAVVWLIVLYRMPLRSPRAIPFVLESKSEPGSGAPAPA